ncbi:peptide chain release factor 1 [Candidatus Jorgensenbacteria bacterium CG_4_10_14_0_8_um_filter_39_13]|uniref:Peptide chain release factor 1 n=2 Tax=Candidatus Joergenseniibacteriota TaxID=1752739 RepID=A0A2M7RG20_9BACT|nr:MAG: peptide chain release factor 1 [Candidatus Jorgensenbacteria bacterium CG11_big_fil_rev_8_21_14_0_20_38_23]PIV13127.1 MAG: peptide chain release factor 1 [Candidatus Jorgensenbacteria bacterium CG03_land_8_20_14_0_80_38_39]PIW97844.1 MAG: peptide chain release factor 1 [Candidatus Jorgensenbacteria bacterium CG_4_8_14_3_um_filter_38_10]PIY95527.1 MAG: peptide chain release factor 1 [Candidatus Jorgensenbacteria bacterium CG_4_10_14_0_8_um_filter_39_13]PJA94920.1 MAG: peptide chain relea
MESKSISKIILEIRAGTGGEEAALFAGDLGRMYQKYAVKKGWQFIILDYSQSSLKGYKTLIAEISSPSTSSGQNLYEILKNESGVHRVQRVPETEKSGRIHTSTVSVAILPEVEPKEIQINPQDLEITFFHSSGPGGQNVNKVETAVRIRHIPSGLVVASQSERSQARNKELAMNILRAKFYEIQKTAEEQKIDALRKEQVGWAEREEKIRTYNFPQDRITDHRINKKWHNIENILNGELEPIIKALKN